LDGRPRYDIILGFASYVSHSAKHRSSSLGYGLGRSGSNHEPLLLWVLFCMDLSNWLIARAASFYQLVLQAALVTGRVALGLIADQFVIMTALLSASTTKAVGLLVKLRYPLKADKDIEFTMAMQDLSTVRKRDGAFYWGLFRHDKKENVYIESFLVESWVEHLRQHERMTVADRSIQEHALAFHTDERPLKVSHFIASPFKGDSQRTDDDDNI
jgi:hypothetical protein